MKVGDLAAAWAGRIILIVDIDDEWVYGIELGETHVAKYKHHVLKSIV